MRTGRVDDQEVLFRALPDLVVPQPGILPDIRDGGRIDIGQTQSTTEPAFFTTGRDAGRTGPQDNIPGIASADQDGGIFVQLAQAAVRAVVILLLDRGIGQGDFGGQIHPQQEPVDPDPDLIATAGGFRHEHAAVDGRRGRVFLGSAGIFGVLAFIFRSGFWLAVLVAVHGFPGQGVATAIGHAADTPLATGSGLCFLVPLTLGGLAVIGGVFARVVFIRLGGGFRVGTFGVCFGFDQRLPVIVPPGIDLVPAFRLLEFIGGDDVHIGNGANLGPVLVHPAIIQKDIGLGFPIGIAKGDQDRGLAALGQLFLGIAGQLSGLGRIGFRHRPQLGDRLDPDILEDVPGRDGDRRIGVQIDLFRIAIELPARRPVGAIGNRFDLRRMQGPHRAVRRLVFKRRAAEIDLGFRPMAGQVHRKSKPPFIRVTA